MSTRSPISRHLLRRRTWAVVPAAAVVAAVAVTVGRARAAVAVAGQVHDSVDSIRGVGR
jgi:hypothetical protein